MPMPTGANIPDTYPAWNEREERGGWARMRRWRQRGCAGGRGIGRGERDGEGLRREGSKFYCNVDHIQNDRWE